MSQDDLTPIEKTGKILQYVGLSLFFVPFLAIPGGMACSAMNFGNGGVPEVFVIGPGSMCIGFGGFFMAFVGQIMYKGAEARRRLEPSWPIEPSEQAPPEPEYSYPPIEKRIPCRSCGAPPSKGSRCEYCGAYY